MSTDEKKYIHLERQFQLLIKGKPKDSLPSWRSFGKIPTEYSITWKNLFLERRCVVLAEAGSGKTVEFQEQVNFLKSQGKKAFFLRVEDIEDKEFDFQNGDFEDFETWLASTSEDAYFFLDSVDEARLTSPKAFRNALQYFSSRIKTGLNRCFIFISSRFGGWVFGEDESKVNHLLPYSEDNESPNNETLKIYALEPLNDEMVKEFSISNGIEDFEQFIQKINELNLTSLTSRPFDLSNMLYVWKRNGIFDSRLELIKQTIRKRLKDNHNPENSRSETSFDQRMLIAMRLAASTILMKKQDIYQDSQESMSMDGILASDFMDEFNKRQIEEVLNCAIFDDLLYGKVRFRHREIQEVLAAQWFAKCLKINRKETEDLFFKKTFNNIIIPPLLSPVVPWLASLDKQFLTKVIEVIPEVLLEDGDLSQLSSDSKKELILRVIERIKNHKITVNLNNFMQLAQLADNDLDSFVKDLLTTNLYIKEFPPIPCFSKQDLVLKQKGAITKIAPYNQTIFFLAQIARRGKLKSCLEPLTLIALSHQYDFSLRLTCMRSIFAIGTPTENYDFCEKINQNFTKSLHPELGLVILGSVFQKQIDLDLPKATQTFLQILARIEYSEKGTGVVYSGLEQALENCIETIHPTQKSHIFNGIIDLIIHKDSSTLILGNYLQINPSRMWMVSAALKFVCQCIEDNKENWLLEEHVFELLFSVTMDKRYALHTRNLKKNISNIIEALSLSNQNYYHFINKLVEVIERYSDDSQNFLEKTDGFYNLDSYQLINSYLNTKDYNDSTTEECTFENQYIAKFLATLKHIKNFGEKPLVRQFFFYSAFQISYFHQLSVKNAKKMQNILKKLKDQSPKVFDNYDTFVALHKKFPKASIKKDLSNSEILKQKLETSLVDKGLNEIKQIDFDHLNFLQLALTQHIFMRTPTDFPRSYFSLEKISADFSPEVAEAYREFTVRFWQDNSIEASISLEKRFIGLYGITMEFESDPEYFTHLTEPELEKVLIYIFQAFHGFPFWFESLYKCRKDYVVKYLENQIKSQLDHIHIASYRVRESHQLIYKPRSPSNYTLYQICETAPWLHADVAQILIDIICDDALKINEEIVSVVHKLLLIAPKNLNISKLLSDLAKAKIMLFEKGVLTLHDNLSYSYIPISDACTNTVLRDLMQGQENLVEEIKKLYPTLQIPIADLEIDEQKQREYNYKKAIWYVLLFIYSPEEALKWFKSLLIKQTHQEASCYVNYFLHGLINSEHPFLDKFNPQVSLCYLKELFLLACKYLPLSQRHDARDILFKVIEDSESKEGYNTLIELAEHPEIGKNFSVFIKRKAYETARVCGDLQPFRVKDILLFEYKTIFNPKSVKELHTAVVSVLLDIKDHLENDDVSPYRTWQKVTDEGEMRILLTEQLDFKLNKFNTAQEYELANRQRLDFKVTHQDVEGRIPIELKIANNWTGIEYLQKVEDQLIRDYLRPENAAFGIFLIVQTQKYKKWEVNGKLVGLNELELILRQRIDQLVSEDSKLEDVKLIVIDTLIRSHKNNK